MKIKVVVSIFISVVFLFVSCSVKNPKTKTFYTYFDTVISVSSYAKESEKDFDENCRELENLLGYYHRLFDIYNEYSGMNNLCTVNKNAGSAVIVDGEIIRLLKRSLDFFDVTNGEVDIMLGPVLKLWHKTLYDGAAIPASEELKSAAYYCKTEYLEIDETSSSVKLLNSHASIDVGAVAKGYVTEKLAQYLENKGVTSYVINAGGNVRLVGKKPESEDWTVAIRNPDNNSNGYALVLNLHDTSCVTSGVYERKVEINGVEYHHIIDKDSLKPASYYASVSVICKDSFCADALSTALFCMPLAQGIELINSLSETEAVWIFPDGSIMYSEGVEKLVRK